MPWECKTCNVTIVADDAPCSECGSTKLTWTMVADHTRAFAVTRRRKRVVLLRGVEHSPLEEGDPGYSERETEEATRAYALTKAEAQQLADAGLRPAPHHILIVRLSLKKTETSVQLTKLFAVQEQEVLEFPQELPGDGSAHDARYVFVYGPEELSPDLRFEELEVVDLSEDSDTGCAPEVGAGALKRKRKDLPVLLGPLGHVHASLRDPRGKAIVDTPLEWTLGGEPAPSDLGLPENTDAEGRIRVGSLPLGRYEVSPRDAERSDFRPAGIPWLRTSPPDPHLQRVKWAQRPVHETEFEAPRGFLFAALLDPQGRPLRNAGLTWWHNGAPVTSEALQGATLPDALDGEGRVRAAGLPLGTWALQPAMQPERWGGYRPTEVPWLSKTIEEPHQQRVKVATPPVYEEGVDLREDPQ
jgi:hypothetical protein